MNEHQPPSTDETLRKDPLAERLAKFPHLRERIETILSIAEQNGGALDKADAAEGALLDEVRALGRETLTEWANHGHQKAVQESKTQTPKAVRHRKKN